ncbi:hypothetical protein [Paenibacillus elgii]|nr:hypothetical protein [Paenibacillus elgii]
MSSKWKLELIFTKRDEKGVIIAFSDKTPEDYEDPVNYDVESGPERNIGD